MVLDVMLTNLHGNLLVCQPMHNSITYLLSVTIKLRPFDHNLSLIGKSAMAVRIS